MAVSGLRRLAAALAVAALTGVVCPSTGGARMPADLNLKESVDSRVVVIPQPNPHDELECTVCHLGSRTERRPGVVRVADEFLDDSLPDSICYECHEPWTELHPNRIDPFKGRQKVTVPSNLLPLRFVGEGWYTIVCMTCHDVHFPHDGFKLLRGYSLNPKVQPSRFSDRLGFCETCHGDQFEFLTPHKVRNRQGGCTLCHVRKPTEGRAQPLRTNINTLCTYCHPVFPEPHYLHFNPFPGLEQETIWKSGVPLRDGTYTCVTCHQPHGETTFPAYLRGEFVDLTRVSVRINPHEKGVFCQNCHVDPQLSRSDTKRPATLLEKDVDLLCARCHVAGKVKSMDHYLGPVAAGASIPGDLPLKEGRITCITCHEPGCGPTNPENPAFLRGNPGSVKAVCARCHDWKKLATRNTHVEFRNGQGCDLCHEVNPTPRETDSATSPGPLKADQNFICLPCHDDFPHPGTAKHTVKPAQAEFVNVDTEVFPLDRYQRITCYSCHQIMRITQKRSFLRGKDPSCQHCHPY